MGGNSFASFFFRVILPYWFFSKEQDMDYRKAILDILKHVGTGVPRNTIAWAAALIRLQNLYQQDPNQFIEAVAALFYMALRYAEKVLPYEQNKIDAAINTNRLWEMVANLIWFLRIEKIRDARIVTVLNKLLKKRVIPPLHDAKREVEEYLSWSIIP